MLALTDSLDGIDLSDLDVYVGVSSGGFVAAALANGISPAQMYRLFIDDGADAALTPEIFLRPALSEFMLRAALLPRLAGRAAMQYLRDPFRRGLMESLATLSHALPTGMFDNRAVGTFLERLFAAPGRTNDFRKLGRKLFLVATNLDTGAPVTFGGAGRDQVPISTAIEASAALPGMFPPVVIDGEHYVDGALNKTLHASVALDEGVELLLCINPLVPFDASRAAQDERLTGAKLNEGGLPIVLSQTFRAIIHSRMKVGMEKYRREYPACRRRAVRARPRGRRHVLREHLQLFATTAAVRRGVRKDAPESHRARRFPCAAAWHDIGISLRRERLADRHRGVDDALSDPRPLHAQPGTSVRRTARDLTHALNALERWLDGSKAGSSSPRSNIGTLHGGRPLRVVMQRPDPMSPASSVSCLSAARCS